MPMLIAGGVSMIDKQTGGPVIPEEAEPVSDMWQVTASIVVGFVLFAIAVFAAVLFVTGVWIWSLLI